MTQEEIDALISGGIKAGSEQQTATLSEEEQARVAVEQPAMPSFDGVMTDPKIISPFDPKVELLYDLPLTVSIELGRTNMLIRDILRLARGSVIEFDRLASEPVDVLVNGKKVAEGEVVVIDKHFGIRITTLVDSSMRRKAQ